MTSWLHLVEQKHKNRVDGTLEEDIVNQKKIFNKKLEGKSAGKEKLKASGGKGKDKENNKKEGKGDAPTK